MQCSLRSTRTAPRRTRRTAPLLRAIFTAALVLAGGQALGLVQGLGIAQAQTAQAQTAPAGAEAPRPGSETSGESQRKAQSIARRTMSPFCPGRTLADCPSEHAAAWRREIQVMLDEGRTAQEIQEEFERRAGGDLSGSPNRAAGYGLSLGLAAASLAVLYGLLQVLRGRRPTAPDGAPAQGKPGETSGDAATAAAVTDPKLDERLERELAEELDDDEDD
ncbi:MAG: hypothetical protein GX607_21000 [Myxococcales bacterium]|jgi:cytochrome c-type biogenesis protein CcmH/NrfF|nr:hypothetical protein [Myxococcales bacterium]